MPEQTAKAACELRESGTEYLAGREIESPSMLDDALSMTLWERIQANDDMMNFGAMLRTAMEKRNAKPR